MRPLSPSRAPSAPGHSGGHSRAGLSDHFQTPTYVAEGFALYFNPGVLPAYTAEDWLQPVSEASGYRGCLEGSLGRRGLGRPVPGLPGTHRYAYSWGSGACQGLAVVLSCPCCVRTASACLRGVSSLPGTCRWARNQRCCTVPDPVGLGRRSQPAYMPLVLCDPGETQRHQAVPLSVGVWGEHAGLCPRPRH